jgi:hypothetical protein
MFAGKMASDVLVVKKYVDGDKTTAYPKYFIRLAARHTHHLLMVAFGDSNYSSPGTSGRCRSEVSMGCNWRVVTASNYLQGAVSGASSSFAARS